MSRLNDICPDPALLARAAMGDVGAQEQLYVQLAGPVFALIRRLVRDYAAAEDLFQDSLMAVYANLGAFRSEAPFGVWVRRIVVSRCFMHLRSPWQRAREALLQRDGEEDEPVAAFQQVLEDQGSRVDLERALSRLAPLARAVVWLHDVEGLTHEEIAESFGRSASFSKSQLSRAHAALRVSLGPVNAPANELVAARLRSAP